MEAKTGFVRRERQCRQAAERIRQEADRLLTMENDTVRSAAQAILAAAAELEE